MRPFFHILNFLSRTGVRLALWYSAVFIASAVLLFVLAYLLLDSSLRESDRQIVTAKLNHYATLAKAQGLEGLLAGLKQEHEANSQAGYYVRVLSPQGQTLLLTLPAGWSGEEPLETEDVRLVEKRRWVLSQTDRFGRVIEFTGSRLAGDIRLTVGFTLEGRDRLLTHFMRHFTLLLAPLLLLALAGGYFISNRALMPVRDLIKTVRNVDFGSMDSRVTVRSSAGQEMRDLTRLFNAMLERIQALILGMRSALDNVGHDMRTPITRLRGSVETVLNRDASPEELRESLMDAAEESERLADMIHALMDISEAETGVMRLEKESFDRGRLTAEAVDLYQMVAEDKGVDLALTTDEVLPAMVDVSRMRQAVANLLDNAIKYTDEGGFVTVAAERSEDGTVIQVHDTGRGVAKEDLPHIFDRLYRGDKSRSERGLGLGLSLVRAVVRAHGGQVDVRSTPGEGSTFSIILPEAAVS